MNIILTCTVETRQEWLGPFRSSSNAIVDVDKGRLGPVTCGIRPSNMGVIFQAITAISKGLIQKVFSHLNQMVAGPRRIDRVTIQHQAIGNTYSSTKQAVLLK